MLERPRSEVTDWMAMVRDDTRRSPRLDCARVFPAVGEYLWMDIFICNPEEELDGARTHSPMLLQYYFIEVRSEKSLSRVVIKGS